MSIEKFELGKLYSYKCKGCGRENVGDVFELFSGGKSVYLVCGFCGRKNRVVEVEESLELSNGRAYFDYLRMVSEVKRV